MRAVAVNVGANTNQPGFRAPVFADGSFAFVPIPEPEPTREPRRLQGAHDRSEREGGARPARETVPTYGDLAPDLPVEIPEDLQDTPVHLDPEFAEYPCCERYTYGDPHGVKARPLADLEAGDWALFYATLETASGDPPAWQPSNWGAYLVGGFRLARDPVTDYDALGPEERLVFANNAHVKRREMDAAVLLHGDPEASGLFDRAVPLSAPSRGVDANRLVTELSSDSGKGPWWRRPLRFDADATATLREVVETRSFEEWR